jgi:hypothetical protein
MINNVVAEMNCILGPPVKLCMNGQKLIEECRPGRQAANAPVGRNPEGNR